MRRNLCGLAIHRQPIAERLLPINIRRLRDYCGTALGRRREWRKLAESRCCHLTATPVLIVMPLVYDPARFTPDEILSVAFAKTGMLREQQREDHLDLRRSHFGNLGEDQLTLQASQPSASSLPRAEKLA